MPGRTVMTSESGTWPSVCDGTRDQLERARIVAEPLARRAGTPRTGRRCPRTVEASTPPTSTASVVGDVRGVDAEQRGAVEVGPHRWSRRPGRAGSSRGRRRPGPCLHLLDHLLAVLLELVEIGAGDHVRHHRVLAAEREVVDLLRRDAGALRDVGEDLLADLLHDVGLAARAGLRIGQVDVDVADVGLALIAAGDRDERRVDLGNLADLARDALGDQRRRLERRALGRLEVDLELRLVVGRQEVAADLACTSGSWSRTSRRSRGRRPSAAAGRTRARRVDPRDRTVQRVAEPRSSHERAALLALAAAAAAACAPPSSASA